MTIKISVFEIFNEDRLFTKEDVIELSNKIRFLLRRIYSFQT